MSTYLSTLRLILTIPVVYLILSENFLYASFVFTLGAVTDWLDGNFARKNGTVSNFGKLFDPYVDKVFVILPLIALVEKNVVSSIPVILITFRELSISFFRSLAVERGVYIEASTLGKIKAFSEFLSIILLLTYPQAGKVILYVSVFLAYLSAIDYLKRYLRTASI